MTNSANEPLPVDHETAINDDSAHFDPIEPSASVADEPEQDMKVEDQEGLREHDDVPADTEIPD